MPYLMDKSEEETKNILDNMNLKYTFTGSGTVIKQEPNPGEELSLDTNITIEFSEEDR